MRILISGQTYYPGNNGQAIFTIHLAEGLARVGHEVHVVVPNTRYQYHMEMINDVYVHKVRALNIAAIHPEAYLALLARGDVQRVFRQYPPDIVHLQDHYFLSRDVTLTAARMGVPILGTNHFLPENVLPRLKLLPLPDPWKITILWKLMLWTYNHLVMITTPTQTAARILLRQNVRPPVVHVSCGVDTQQFQPNPTLDRQAACARFGLDPNKVLLLYVGRLDGEKRIDLLLRVLAVLAKAGRTDLQLAIAGQGAHSGALRRLAQELDITDQVRFLGYVSNEDLRLLYQTGHIFCMPSPAELQSIASLEAMATGLPVLAANARALPELVQHQVNGYLFEPGKVESAAQGITYLIDQRAYWPAMGQASRARALMHGVGNTIRRYEDVYHETVKRFQSQSYPSRVPAFYPGKLDEAGPVASSLQNEVGKRANEKNRRQ